MGIVPENEYLLGLEGAGTIRRVGRSAHSFNVGQRVLFHNKGAFANRLKLPAKKVHAIPDAMSFEVSLHGQLSFLLLMLSGCGEYAKCLPRSDLQSPASCEIEKEPSELDPPAHEPQLTLQRILIHSASGGVGIAAIQICQYIGAEVSLITLSVTRTD
jgi:NADPH:quinone reductase-like Zn-dependent oxidoreductase